MTPELKGTATVPVPNSPADGGKVDTSGHKVRIIGLDGIRGILCLMIAVTHVTGHYTPITANTWMTNMFGFSLVYFFVLSGFLLSLPFIKAVIKDRAAAVMPDAADYFVHRIARIMPGYIVIFLLVNFVFQASYLVNPVTAKAGGFDAGTGMITDPGMLAANLTLTQSYFPQYLQTGINPSWSLTLEYAFYASLPLLFFVVFAARKRFDINPWVLACAVPGFLFLLGIVGRSFIPLVNSYMATDDFYALNWGANWAAVFAKSLLTNSDNFALGMFAAVIFVAIDKGALPERISKRVRLVSTVLILPVLVGSALMLAVASQYVTAGVGIVAGLMILVVVAPLAQRRTSKLATTLDFRPVRFVGEISLSAYLWHFPVLLVLGRLGWMAGDTLPGMLQNILLVLSVTVIMGSITYYLVEKPAMNYAKKVRGRRKQRKTLAAATA